MAIKDNREYRAMSFECRNDEGAEENYVVRGYASTFKEYVLFSDGDVDYCERIEPTAFDEADMSDVIFLYNHEGMVYARQKNGTLKLTIDEHGLLTEADLSSTEQSRQMYEQIRSGLIDQMSFAFTVAEDELEKEEGKYTRVIKKVGKVFDVSCVSIPANPDTDIATISARSYFNGVIEEEATERLLKAEREAKKQKIRILGGI